jgi:DNA-binding LytR/AlgR family response regulator
MINCLLLDDEPLAIELLEDYIGKIPFLHMVAKCTNAVDALDVLNLNDIQLLFLDIRMPDIDGIQLLKSLSLAHRPLVVFTTGYPEYAIEGYNFEVLDYLLKPISFERFLKTASKAQFALHAGKNVPQQSNDNRDFIFIKSDYKTIKVNFEDIIYIEGLKDYCKIYTTTGSILTLRSMKTVEQILPKERFARIHRSYIISISKIKMISKNQVIVNDDIHIPISESFKDNFNSIIDARQI